MRSSRHLETCRCTSPLGCDLSAELPGQFKLSTWALSDQEILEELPNLNKNGIRLYHEANFGSAVDVYRKALDSLEQVSLKEHPGTTKWKILQEMKVPLQLNYARCKFCIGEYNEVVTLTTSVLEFDQDNDKALFQRADAHILLHNLVQAGRDYERLVMLNSPLAGAAESLLTQLKTAVQVVMEEMERRLMRNSIGG